MSNRDRWTTAVHEAAHAVCALALGGECSMLTIHHDGSGLAFIDGLIPFDHAVAVAAPIAAAELLSDSPPPATEPAPQSELSDVRDAVYDLTPREKFEVNASWAASGRLPTDEQFIARYCIAGLEHEAPERWAERYHGVHHIAYQVVRDHQSKILTVARALYRDGILSAQQIQELCR